MVLEKSGKGCEVSMEEPPFVGGDDVEPIEEEVAVAVVRIPLVVASVASSELADESGVTSDEEAEEGVASGEELEEISEEEEEEVPRPMRELVVECGDEDLVLSSPRVAVEVLESIPEGNGLQEEEESGGSWQVIKREKIEEKRRRLREKKKSMRREIAAGQQV